jgi:hypothetical protein
LNSSKITHEPEDAIPLKNLSTFSYSMDVETFWIKHSLASVRAKSFVVSVLPVPKGPSGAPPYWNYIATSNAR